MAVDPLAIVPIITDAGLAASFRAQGDGIQLALSHVAIGRGLPDGGGWKGYAPDRAQTTLKREDLRVAILSGQTLPGHGFRILARFPPSVDTELPVRELGVFLETGEMLAVWSEAAAYPLTARTPRASIDLAFDLYLAQVPLTALTLIVEQPDIPDTLGALYQVLALSAREATQHVNAEMRRLRQIFAGA